MASRKKSKKKNREILIVSALFCALFVWMIGYFTVYSVSHEEELINNSYNSRQRILASEDYRGTIFDRNGEVLAATVVDSDGTERREYPYRNLFAHTVGYSGKGKTGLESRYNYYLISSDISDAAKVENQLAGRKNPGNELYTTIDLTLQQAADRAMGIYKGAIIALDPKTGQVLAMVSKPDFDANTIAEKWDSYLADEENSVLLNRAAQGLYQPGSTFKIVTALEYLNQNENLYSGYHFDCSGSTRIGEETIHCFHGMKHGTVDFQTSFSKSCNTSFAHIGMSLDRTKFGNTATKLLFHNSLPFELPTSISSIDLGEKTTDAALLQASIGQGRTSISPLHLAMITSGIANGGVMMKPYLADRIVSPDQTVIKSFSPEEVSTIMTKEQADILTELMRSVVTEGTGKKLSEADYCAAGKTGSAEFSDSTSDSHAWFTGFAPADDPKIVVTVIIESAGSGGDYAVPMAKRVFDAYFSERETNGNDHDLR
ncbi:MAG: penicillin-binding protein 2 [Lachnospiraceae bacterium]|nr:penicillin-binding protein 2 [Lachnospiraceae bacterium]